MNPRSPFLYLRLLVGLVAVAASALWAHSTWTRTRNLGAFLEYEDREYELYELMKAQGEDLKVPDAAEPKLLMASMHGVIFFPPDDAQAAIWAARALHNRPLESQLWVILATHLFFSGQEAQARTALARADELDPNYPLQRLGAIRLWTLMGERSRAGILAAQIARLGHRERADAARELMRAGWPRAEIFTRLEGGSLSDGEMIELLDLLKIDNQAQCRELLMAIPPERLRQSRPLRVVASRHAVDARLLDQIERVWRLERPDAPDVPRFPPDFQSFELAFSQTPLAVGWQGPPKENWVILRNRVADEPGLAGQTGSQFPALIIQYRDTPDESRRHSRWPFYRMPLPADEELTLTVRVRAVPSDRSAAKIVAIGGRQRIESNVTDLRTDLYQTLSLKIPAESTSRVITFQLDRTRARSIFDSEAELIIQSIEIETRPVVTQIEDVEESTDDTVDESSPEDSEEEDQ